MYCHHIWTEQEIKILKENAGLLSRQEIHQKYFPELTSNQVRWKMKHLKLINKQPIRHHDQEYFTILDNERAYWAGFIGADGHLNPPRYYTHGKRSKKTGNSLIIRLAERDEQHLLKLKHAIKYDGNLLRGTSINPHTGIKSGKNVVLQIYQFGKNMEALNKIYNLPIGAKSLILEPPVNLPLEQQYAYLKGFIDGDGSMGIYKCGGDKILYKLHFIGSSPMMEWIKNLIIETTEIEIQAKIFKYKNMYELHCSGCAAILFAMFLKDKIKTPELERKWSKIDEYFCLPPENLPSYVNDLLKT